MSELLNFDQLYPGRFIKAGDLAGKKVTLTLGTIRREQLEGEDGAEWKVIVTFAERPDKELVLPKLNATCIVAMFGKDLTNWRGKRVVLYATTDYMPMRKGGVAEPCIRIWGSPDIERDVPVCFEFTRKIGGKTTRGKVNMTMRATGRAPQEPSAPTSGTPNP